MMRLASFLASFLASALRKPSPRMLPIIRGTTIWELRKDTDDEGVSILIATCPSLKLVAWGYTEQDLTEYVVESMGLLFSHLHKHGRLIPLVEREGFTVEDHPVLSAPGRGATPVSPVNGTSSVLQPAFT